MKSTALLDRFFLIDSAGSGTLLPGEHDTSLVALSVLVAVLTSYMALQLAVKARQSPSHLLRVAALSAGALTLGAGVWAMHFIGMLAFQLCTEVRYDRLLTGLSFLPAMGAAWVALNVLAGRRSAGLRLLGGGVLMGAGIGLMHYSGMAAMQMSASLRYDPLWFAASILLAVVLAVLALWVRAGLAWRAWVPERLADLLAAVVMGAAISGMHYTAMRAARFIGVADLDPAAALEQHMGLALAIAVITLAVSALTAAVSAALRYRIVFRDLMRSEQALAITEQQHRSLIANLPGVAVHALHDFGSGQTRLQFVSDAIESLAGWRAAELVQDPLGLDRVIHPDDQAIAGSQARQGKPVAGTYHLEYRILRRDGQVRWVSETGTITPIAGSAEARVDALVLDVTEARLRNAEFTGVLTAIRRALVVIEFDLDGQITHVNDNFLALVGYSAEELLGQHHRLLCLPAETATPEYAEHWAALRRGEFRSGEYERVGKDGRHIWIQATYNPILDAAGKPQRVVKFVNDLTERHRLEQDLRCEKERAEQAAAAKSTFLANMSHEIRTPMNAIIGFTDVVLDGELPASSRQHMQTVQRSARALLGLLNDILDTAKLEHGAVELESRPFALRQLCQDVLSTLELSARRKGLVLALDLAPGLPEVFKGDPLRLRQVLLNLAGNAVKFTAEGGVSLTAERLPDGRLELSVLDTGIGIAPDRIERIFDPFAQADATMARRFGGTGLGTTIARQLVQLMGGEIGVESELGQGSRFWVRLPLAAMAGEATTFGALAGPTIKALPPLRILIADDVPENLVLLELRLREQGHSVSTAADGEQALALMRQGGLDLALLDVQMPVMDGLQACRALREIEAAEGRPRLPVIALTASAMQGDRELTAAAGMDGFAVKPIDWPALLTEIARVLGLASGTSTAAPSSAPVADHGLPAGHDWSAGLARWGDAALLRNQLQRFLDETLKTWPQGREDAALAHRLRGTLANLGLPDTEGQLAALEKGEHAVPETAWREQHARLIALHTTLQAGPAATMAAPTTPPAAPWNRSDAEALDAALARGELPDALSQQLLQSLPTGERESLEAALMDFDFDAARATLARLMKELG